MKKKLVLTVIMAIVLGFSIQAHAALDLIGQGTSTYGTYNLIYDTDLDVTWYDYSNAVDTWDNQVDWVDLLSVTFGSNTYSDWRLPSALNPDGSGPCLATGCTDSEMGHLFYTELGNESGAGNILKTGDFQNLSKYDPPEYWLANESSVDSTYAWVFATFNGGQYAIDKLDTIGAIAVMNGMAVVPEPISSILFLIGGATLGFRQWKKRKTS